MPGGLSLALDRLRLALEVLAVYLWVRLLLARYGTVPTLTKLRCGVSENSNREIDRDQIVDGLRLGRAAGRVLRPLPFDNRCLVRSLVVSAMLARRGIYASVVIGVRPAPSFGAHAWVEVAGQPLLEPEETTFSRLTAL